jgi:hypothetical protein
MARQFIERVRADRGLPLARFDPAGSAPARPRIPRLRDLSAGAPAFVRQALAARRATEQFGQLVPVPVPRHGEDTE